MKIKAVRWSFASVQTLYCRLHLLTSVVLNFIDMYVCVGGCATNLLNGLTNLQNCNVKYLFDVCDQDLLMKCRCFLVTVKVYTSIHYVLCKSMVIESYNCDTDIISGVGP